MKVNRRCCKELADSERIVWQRKCKCKLTLAISLSPDSVAVS